MKKAMDVLLLIAVIVPIVLLFWPFAIWGDAMSFILRVIPSLAVQTLLCRAGKNRIIRAIPLLLTEVFALWGTYLYITFPYWSNATFGDLVADYASPFICCAIAFCVYALSKKE